MVLETFLLFQIPFLLSSLVDKTYKDCKTSIIDHLKLHFCTKLLSEIEACTKTCTNTPTTNNITTSSQSIMALYLSHVQTLKILYTIYSPVLYYKTPMLLNSQHGIANHSGKALPKATSRVPKGHLKFL